MTAAAREIHVNKAADISRMIAVLVANDLSHRAELMCAVRDGAICVIEPRRDFIVAMRVLKTTSRPTLVVVGDDDYAATGPDGWSTLPNLLRWARGAMVHGTGADISSYRAAIGMTLFHRKFVLVETDSAHVQEWGGRFLARRIPTIGLVPSSGAHPLPLARGKAQ